MAKTKENDHLASKGSFEPGQVPRSLMDPDAIPHDVGRIELLETHISWVILTGDFVYKIKKPVRFEFVDYSTLESRRLNCLKEVELNQRFAPELYLGVVPILQDETGRLAFGQLNSRSSSDDRQIVEYAVVMREFPQDAIVASRLEDPDLTPMSVETFGEYVATIHETVETANPNIPDAQSDCVWQNANENTNALVEAFRNDVRLAKVQRLGEWTSTEYQRLQSSFQQRLDNGWVRRCHGDMHLKNMIQVEGRVTVFDGVEFNEGLIWNDVLSEIAFPVMDFWARGRVDLGWRLLNGYLGHTGDYDTLDVLRFYLVYRALVRAKVTWLNPQNHTLESRDQYPVGNAEFDRLAGPWDKYLDTAMRVAFEFQPRLAITHGFSGSGKTTRAREHVDREGWILIRSDVERHRMWEAMSGSGWEKYSGKMTEKVYQHLLTLARRVLQSGLPVIVDATFLKSPHRKKFSSLAQAQNVSFEIFNCVDSVDVLRQRIANRKLDASEATAEVLERQIGAHDPLDPEEQKWIRQFDA